MIYQSIPGFAFFIFGSDPGLIRDFSSQGQLRLAGLHTFLWQDPACSFWEGGSGQDSDGFTSV